MVRRETFSKKTTEESAQDLCEHFLVRLVQLIAAGGKTRRVVLSSTWRRPQHKKRRQVLEHRISTHLGEPFVFDDRTDLVPEQSAADRICTVGDYIANYSKCQNSRSRNSLTVSALRSMFPSPPMSDGDRGLPGRISIHWLRALMLGWRLGCAVRWTSWLLMDEHDEYHDDDVTGYRIREMFEAKLLAELSGKMAGKVEPDPAIVVAQSAVTELVADQDRSVALAARDGTTPEDPVEAKDASSKLERLQPGSGRCR